jgi:hypothetical protein
MPISLCELSSNPNRFPESKGMTQETTDLMKVKLAAVVGIGSPWLTDLFLKFGPALDFIIKLGQVGVAIVTILYIWRKWRKLKDKNE